MFLLAGLLFGEVVCCAPWKSTPTERSVHHIRMGLLVCLISLLGFLGRKVAVLTEVSCHAEAHWLQLQPVRCSVVSG